MKKFLAILAVLAVLASAAPAAELTFGTFVSQSAAAKSINDQIPVFGTAFGVEKTQFTSTTVSLSLAYTGRYVNSGGEFVRGGAEVEKTLCIGDPNSKLAPYVGAGIGGYYVNGFGESGLNFGSSLLAGLKIGKSFFVEGKYTDVRNSAAADGFSVSLGSTF